MALLGVVGLLQMGIFWFDCVCVVIGCRVAFESLVDCVRVVGVVLRCGVGSCPVCLVLFC